jgi:hypothetical protein
VAEASKAFGINIISWIIGSGLIVFTVNTIYSDYIKQPNLDLFVYQSPEEDSSHNRIIGTTIINTGRALSWMCNKCPYLEKCIAVRDTQINVVGAV